MQEYDDDMGNNTPLMEENDAFVGSRNLMNRKLNNSEQGDVVIPDGGVLFTTTTNAVKAGNCTPSGSTTIHLQHQHHVVKLQCGNKPPQQLNNEPLTTFIGYFNIFSLWPY